MQVSKLMELFSHYPSLLLLGGLFLVFLLGLYEERSLRMKELARITWFFGVLVFSIMVATWDWLGWARWGLSTVCFGGGVYYIFVRRR
jgi:uncharacterized membrane protein YiaA